jgi:hypothetical protein
MLATILSVLHPRPHFSFPSLAGVIDTWILVHFIQIPLYGLVALVLWLLVSRSRGASARIARVASGVFVVFYSAFEGMQGMGLGILVKYVTTLPPNEEAIARNVVMAYWGAIADGAYRLMVVVAQISWVVAIFAVIGVVAAPAVSRINASVILLVATAAAAYLVVGRGSRIDLVFVVVSAAVLATVGLFLRPRLPIILLAMDRSEWRQTICSR